MTVSGPRDSLVTLLIVLFRCEMWPNEERL